MSTVSQAHAHPALEDTVITSPGFAAGLRTGAAEISRSDIVAMVAGLLPGFLPAPEQEWTLARTAAGCTQTVTLHLVNRYGYIEVDYRVSIAMPEHAIALTFTSEFFCEGAIHSEVNVDTDLAGVRQALAPFVHTALLPFLLRCRDIAGLDGLLNDRQRPFYGVLNGWQGVHFVALYAAWINGNPAFDELVTGHAMYLRSHDGPGAILLALHAWADGVRSGAVPSCRAIDSVIGQSGGRLLAYIKSYDPARSRPLGMAATAPAGVNFVDPQMGFRHIVAHVVSAAPASAPIALVRELFIAEAQYASRGFSVHPCVGPLTQALLTDGQPASMELFDAGLLHGEHVVAAMKTITLPFALVSARASQCRERALTARTDTLRALLNDYAQFLDDAVMLQDAPVNPEAFIASYALSQSHRIGCKWSAGAARHAVDANAAFRKQVVDLVLQAPEQASLVLVCDLFLAENQFQQRRAQLGSTAEDNAQALMLLAEDMLLRGSLRELDLFVMCTSHRDVLSWPLNRMVLPAVMASAYADICVQRSLDFACPERKYRYRNLALYFATLMTERPDGLMGDDGWTPPGQLISLR